MKKIFSVDGGKGGTGKSIFCSCAIDAAINCGKKVLFVEADTSNPDVAKCYSTVVNTVAIALKSREGFMELATAISQSDADVVLISNPGTADLWSENGTTFTQNLHRFDATMNVFWVANRQRDSVEICSKFFKKFPEIPLYFVLNQYWGEAKKFEIWMNSNLRANIMTAGGGEIFFPDCADRVMDEIKNNRLRWDEMDTLCMGNLIEAERMRNECKDIFEPFFM